MRIMHLEFGRHLYGGAAQVRYLIEGLDDCGIENILICPVNSEISKVTCATKVVELSIGGDLDWRLPTRLKNIISFGCISSGHKGNFFSYIILSTRVYSNTKNI